MAHDVRDAQKANKNSEIYKKHLELQHQERNYDKVVKFSKNVQLTYDQVQNWLQRVITKVDEQFGESIGQFTQKTMQFRFEKLQKAIVQQLRDMEDEEDDRMVINPRDYMNDFDCDDYKNKNVRVGASTT